MSDEEARRKEGDAFDVVWMRGPTDDGHGTRVVRARPGRIDAGEVRPLREGKPFIGGGEVVRLEQRADAPALYDVHVETTVPASPDDRRSPVQGGPPQVATRAYRDNWELTFGSDREVLN